jgi:hypothetical protein
MQTLTAPPELAYLTPDYDRVQSYYNAVCGQHSIAAATGHNLVTVCNAVGHRKGWMNPTMVRDTLTQLLGECRVAVAVPQSQNLRPGVNRIQFKGPWLDSGRPPQDAYRHTHYVAMRNGHVLDTLVQPKQWLSLREWTLSLQGHIEYVDGWFITHHFLVDDDLAPPVVHEPQRDESFIALPINDALADVQSRGRQQVERWKTLAAEAFQRGDINEFEQCRWWVAKSQQMADATEENGWIVPAPFKALK